MQILKKTSQHRRDFNAVLICPHCEETQTLTRGYDDANFHQNVIPTIKCDACGKVGGVVTSPDIGLYEHL